MTSHISKSCGEIIKCEGKLIDKPISSDPIEHVRGVAHLVGKRGEKLTRCHNPRDYLDAFLIEFARQSIDRVQS